jgi:ketosteroid isomerase-like protein
MYADDIVFSVFPGTTVLHGQTEFRNALEGFTSRFPDIQLIVRRSVTNGDASAVQWDEIGTEAESGDAAEFHFCGVIEFRSGIIANVARYGSRQP